MKIVCDIDGCIADVRGIVCYLPDWEEYFKHQAECTCIAGVVYVLRCLQHRGEQIVLVTGRPESTRAVTSEWLSIEAPFRYEKLLMRPEDYLGSTQTLKMGWYKELQPDLIIEDDPSVVLCAIEEGLTVLQVHGYRWSTSRDYSPNEIVPPHVSLDKFSFVRNSANVQTPEQTLQILTYELGKVIEYNHKAHVYGATSYYSDANQQREMSDLISMSRMYCEQKEWDYDKLMMLGEEVYLDRMEDIRQHGVRNGKIKRV